MSSNTKPQDQRLRRTILIGLVAFVFAAAITVVTQSISTKTKITPAMMPDCGPLALCAPIGPGVCESKGLPFTTSQECVYGPTGTIYDSGQSETVRYTKGEYKVFLNFLIIYVVVGFGLFVVDKRLKK